MYPVTGDFLAAVRASHDIESKLTMTTLAGDVAELRIEGGTVTVNGGTGMRWQADLVVSASPGTDLYSSLAAEGTLFALEHGIRFGNRSELVPFGTYVATKVPGALYTDRYRLSLADRWVDLEEARFLSPLQPAPGSRVAEITTRVTEALPGVTTSATTTGCGNLDGSRVWQDARTDLIRDLAADGVLEASFDGSGVFVVRDEPAISSGSAGSSTFALTAGEVGTILSAERERPLTKRYNTVVVRPSGPDQTWTQQVAQVADVNHPRHPSKIGVRPLFWSSPTITNQFDALNAAEARLQRLLKAASVMTVNAVSNPALEPGDVGVVVIPETPTTPKTEDDVMIQSIRFNLAEGLMDVDLVTAGLVDVGDAS